MDVAERTAMIRRVAPTFPCLDGWTIDKLLGEGTVGSVFYVCRQADSSTCAAAKIQVLTTPNELAGFRQEVAVQQSFYPFAPKVLATCIAHSKDSSDFGGVDSFHSVDFGIIVMELVDVELDKWLMEPRSTNELLQLTNELTQIWSFLVDSRKTHGDLALFNIGRSKEEQRWLLLDFDRSSVDIYSPETDFYRIQMELYKCTNQSASDIDICNANMTWLRRNGLPQWANIFGLAPMKTAQAAQDKWIDSYQAYCRRANVKCLDPDVWDV